MAARILNTALMRSIASRLNTEGPVRSPAVLNTDEVLVTAGLDSGGFNGRTIYRNQMGASVAGVNSRVIRVAGNTASSPLIDTTGLELRVLGLWFTLDFDAAGAVAFAGKTLNFAIEYDGDPNSISSGTAGIQDLFPWTTVTAGFISYVWALSGHRNGHAGAAAIVGPGPIWVPEGMGLNLDVRVHDGTVFPANTTVIAMAFAVSQPQGSQLPL